MVRMQRIAVHVRNMLIAGTLAAVPITAALFVLWYIDGRVREALGVQQPFIGVGHRAGRASTAWASSSAAWPVT